MLEMKERQELLARRQCTRCSHLLEMTKITMMMMMMVIMMMMMMMMVIMMMMMMMMMMM